MTPGIGIYPGGPHGTAFASQSQRPAYLPRVEEMEERKDRHFVRRVRRARRNRLAIGLALAVSVAGAFGFAIGKSSHTTAEGLMEAMEVEQDQASWLSDEINRTLLELWKMEDVEFSRSRRRR